ncbi:helix-turn-helix domain-containing protein [Streptomyces sp. S07_1.15]|uniref:IclR family transcriptional regulator domain-containing protein n=1 Tax=Streptomyces sp. S07_1.15 TaxID=2873925 RepID=UPI001D15D3A1|nr:IclR family transcriptional regulator C-terminal domain-containing protein [Streptomyces sp. S07_1.15]MCC3652135.1 helix-turn-helix domain-containing protein [Streptomyces sp. S07_1.15]
MTDSGTDSSSTDGGGTDGGRGPHFVQSLERGLAVIRTFSAETPELTLTEVAKATGLSRAAARRFLLTLADLGYVRSDGRLFRLTPRVLDLGYPYLSGLSLAEVAAPHLEQLVATVRESSSAAVLDGEDIVYVSRVPTRRIMTVSISIGTRFPAYATSLGRVLLAGLPPAEREAFLERAALARLTPRTITSREDLAAELETVRAQGWSIVDQELELGLISVAAPVHDEQGRVVAAINVSTHASRATPESIRQDLVPVLLDTAAGIEADLHKNSRS